MKSRANFLNGSRKSRALLQWLSLPETAISTGALPPLAEGNAEWRNLVFPAAVGLLRNRYQAFCQRFVKECKRLG
jgi:hypothetical protein